MSKFFARIITLLLVPCLMADPTLAVALSQTRMFNGHSLVQEVFTAEAIVPSSFISRKTDPGECPGIIRMTRRWSPQTGSLRRVSLAWILAGIIVLSTWLGYHYKSWAYIHRKVIDLISDVFPSPKTPQDWAVLSHPRPLPQEPSSPTGDTKSFDAAMKLLEDYYRNIGKGSAYEVTPDELDAREKEFRASYPMNAATWRVFKEIHTRAHWIVYSRQERKILPDLSDEQQSTELLRILPRIAADLASDPDTALSDVPKGFEPASPALQALFGSPWGGFVSAMDGSPADRAGSGELLIKDAEKIDPQVAGMMRVLVGKADQLKDRATAQSVIEAWYRFNDQYLVPHGLYGVFEIRLSENKLPYYWTMFYKVEKFERYAFPQRPGWRGGMAYGESLSGTHLDFLGAHFGKSTTDLVDMTNIETMMAGIQDVRAGAPYLYDTNKQNSLLPALDEWIRATYAGMTYHELEDILLDSVRIHESTHNAQEQAGVRDLEETAFLAELIHSPRGTVQTIASLADLLMSKEDGPDENAAYVLLNRLAGRDFVHWAIGNDPADVNQLIREIIRLGPEEVQKRARALYEEYPSHLPIDSLLGSALPPLSTQRDTREENTRAAFAALAAIPDGASFRVVGFGPLVSKEKLSDDLARERVHYDSIRKEWIPLISGGSGENVGERPPAAAPNEDELVARVKRIYSEIARQFHQTYGKQVAEDNRRFLERFLQWLPASGSVLDVGTGTGLHAAFVADRFKETHQERTVVGVDISHDQIHIARETHAALLHSYPGLQFQELDARQLADHFAPQSFAGILDMGAFHFLPAGAQERVLKQHFGLLKERGVLFISVKKGPKTIASHPRYGGPEIPMSFFETEQELVDLARHAGFKVSKDNVTTLTNPITREEWIFLIAVRPPAAAPEPPTGTQEPAKGLKTAA